MPWASRSLDSFSRRIAGSLSIACKLSKLGADSNGLIAIDVLNLDTFISSSDQANWLRSNLFQRLGFDLSRDDSQSILMSTSNRNATEAIATRKRKRQLESNEARYLESQSKLHDAVSKFNQRFGEKLSVRSKSGQLSSQIAEQHSMEP
jgi:hypothetical protein